MRALPYLQVDQQMEGECRLQILLSVSQDAVGCQQGVVSGVHLYLESLALPLREGLIISCCELRPGTSNGLVEAIATAQAKQISCYSSLQVFCTSCPLVPHARKY